MIHCKHWISIVLNWSFLFHISCDGNFDTIAQGKHIRVSFLSFCWGVSHYYFITYSYEANRLSIFKKLSYNDVAPIKSLGEIKNSVNKYSEILGVVKVENHDEQVDFLKEKKSDNKQSISTSESKANFLLAFITTFSGVLIYLMPDLMRYKSGSTFQIITIYFLWLSVVITIFNSFTFIFEVVKVRGYRRFSFSDFTNQTQGDNYVILYHYYEWLSSCSDSAYKVGLLKNAEKYCQRVCLLSVLLWYFFQIFPSDSEKKNKTYIVPDYNMVKMVDGDYYFKEVCNEALFI